MRLRIIDLNTPWFWFVMFYRRESGPHVAAHLYGPQRWCKFWWNFWKWEKLPDELAAFKALIPVDQMDPRAVLDATKMCWPGDEPLG